MSGTACGGTPAHNEHGVSYRALLHRERVENLRLLRAYSLALETWMQADAAHNASVTRKKLFARARKLTERALS